MQFINFPEFLKERYKACICISFEAGILDKYKDLIDNFTKTWKQIEDLGTCPFQFRLVFDSSDPTPEEIYTEIKNSSYVEADPSNPSDPPELPWFSYWMKLYFTRDIMPQYLFLDLPICNIHFSTIPVKIQRNYPDWAKDFVAGIETFNIVINPEITQKTQDFYICSDSSAQGFYDIILNITHYHAAHLLRELKDTTTQFVNDNWQGFRNSVRRLFGFGSRVSRPVLVLSLKRLGDICLSCQDYTSALKYYQQLYEEYTDDDPPIENSLLITMSVASLLSTNELDIIQVLTPALSEKGQSFYFYQAMLIMCFFAAINQDLTYARKVLIHISKRISKGHHPFSKVSFPLLMEAASFCSYRGKSALYLFKAANSYRALKLDQNEKICLWRLYRNFKGTGWPQLEQFILLRIAETGDLPIELHKHLEEKSLICHQITTKYLKKLIKELEVTEPVNIGSILIHDLSVKATGFPMSPPPDGISLKQWEQLRKRLFPVAYHPSTDRFTASAWGSDTLDFTNVAVNEPITLHFKLSPTPKEKCNIHNLRLMFNNEQETKIDTNEIPQLTLTSPQQVELTLNLKEEESVILNGIQFLWNNVAPCFIKFPSPMRFESIDKPPVVELDIESDHQETFPNHEIRFTVKTHHVTGDLHSLHIVINTLLECTMISPTQSGGQRWGLSTDKEDNEAVFSVIPTTKDIGKNKVDVFISYTSVNAKITRFAYKCFEFTCKEFPKVSTVYGNNTIFLYSESPIQKVVCNSATISINEFNNSITILEPNPNYQGENELIITRTLLGIETTSIVNISDLYMCINLSANNIQVPQYPIYIDVNIDIISLCNHSKENKCLSLLQPNGTDWLWVGKTVHYLNEPKMNINAKILCMKPFSVDLGLYIHVDNEGSRKFHKLISLH